MDDKTKTPPSAEAAEREREKGADLEYDAEDADALEQSPTQPTEQETQDA